MWKHGGRGENGTMSGAGAWRNCRVPTNQNWKRTQRTLKPKSTSPQLSGPTPPQIYPPPFPMQLGHPPHNRFLYPSPSTPSSLSTVHHPTTTNNPAAKQHLPNP